MPEVPHAGQYHGQPKPVGGVDDFLVADGAAGLNNRRRSGFGNDFYAVGKRKERVRSGD